MNEFTVPIPPRSCHLTKRQVELSQVEAAVRKETAQTPAAVQARDASTRIVHGVRRLQVFREVFAVLIEEFRVYGPLLASIRNEYETVIATLQEEVHRLKPLAPALATANAETERHVAAAERQHSREKAQLIAQRRQLQSYLTELKQSVSSLRLENEQLREEAGTTSERIAHLSRDQATALERHKVMDAEIHDLRSEVADKEQALKVNNNEMSLIVANLAAAERRVHGMIAERDARVDRTVHEELVTKYQTLKRKYGRLRQRSQVQRDQERNAEIERLRSKVAALQARGTVPAPNFESYERRYNFAMPASLATAEDRVVFLFETIDMLHVRLENALANGGGGSGGSGGSGGGSGGSGGTVGGGSGVLEDDDALRALRSRRAGASAGAVLLAPGGGPDVPIYKRLPSTEMVPNLEWDKAETERFVREIWKAKADHDRGRARASRLGDFVHSFFKRQSGDARAAVVMGINLEHACKRYEYDADCALFHRILTGEMHEDVYADQVAMLKGFQRNLLSWFRTTRAAQEAGGGDGDGGGTVERGAEALPKEEVIMAVRMFFAAKPEANVHRLKKALLDDVGAGDVNIRKLFRENEDLDQVHFFFFFGDRFMFRLWSFSAKCIAAPPPSRSFLTHSLHPPPFAYAHAGRVCGRTSGTAFVGAGRVPFRDQSVAASRGCGS